MTPRKVRAVLLAAVGTVVLFAAGMLVAMVVSGEFGAADPTPGAGATSGRTVGPSASSSGSTGASPPVPSSPAPSVSPVTTASRAPTGSARPTGSPTPAGRPSTPERCHDVPLGAPAMPDPAAELATVADQRGVRLEAAWYDPARGVVQVGDLSEDPAWSTSKVPLALAVIRSGRGTENAEAISAALRYSDNDAAELLWRALGPDDRSRARAVDEVFRIAGDTGTTVPDRRLRPPYSIFGQTRWGTPAQVGFLQHLPCLEGADRVVDHMAQVVPGQSWGVGRLPGATFKGGWGPTGSGYLVRQFGWYEAADGSRVLIAIAVQADSFDQGVGAMDALAEALGAP